MSYSGGSEDNAVPVIVNHKAPSSEDYRKYLERGGVTEALKNVLVALHEEPEWPINPNEYICKKFAELCDIPLFEKMKVDILVMQDKIKSLEQKVISLEQELKVYKLDEEQNTANATNL